MAGTSSDQGDVTWDLFEIASLARSGLEAEADRCDRDQSVLGIDARDELRIHELIRAGIAHRYPVVSEQRYPVSRSVRRRSEGERCDIVVLPASAREAPHLTDPLVAGTLFADRGVDPREALWIEVKVVWHHALIDGAAAPNPAYASQLTRLVGADLRKLHGADTLDWSAALVVAFHGSPAIADHDLAAWREKLTVLGVMRRTPIVERFAMTDRIGNAVCSVVIVPVREGSAGW